MDQITHEQTILLNTKTFNWKPEIIQIILLTLASFYFVLLAVALLDGSFRPTYHFFYFAYATLLFLSSFIYSKKSAISPKVQVNDHYVSIKTGVLKKKQQVNWNEIKKIKFDRYCIQLHLANAELNFSYTASPTNSKAAKAAIRQFAENKGIEVIGG